MEKQRQASIDLREALTTALVHLRSQERTYRSPQGKMGHAYHMTKDVRKRMAAEYAERIRLIEQHLSEL